MTALSVTREPAPPSAGSLQLDGAVLRVSAERTEDRLQVDALIDRAFGPGRFAKTAERLREHAGAPQLALCLCAWDGSELVGAVRLWAARIGERPAIFLGPIAVEPAARSHGLGATLVTRACAQAAQAGEKVVILVGDLEFFGALGFEQVPRGQVSPPGPVAAQRLLWRALTPGALDGLEGQLEALSPA